MEQISQHKTMREAPPINVRATLMRLYGYMVMYRLHFVVLLVLLALSVACGLLMPLVVESAMNAIGFSKGNFVDFRVLTRGVVQFAVLATLSAALGYLQERISAKITLSMSIRMRRDGFKAIMNASVSSFERMRKGDLMSRMMNDAEMAAGAFTQSFRQLTSSVLMIVGCAAIMFAKCAPLAAVSVGTAMLSVIVMGALSKLVLPAFTRQQVALGFLNSHIEESLKAFRSCVAGGRKKENQKRMDRLSGDYYARRIEACRLEYLMEPLMMVLGNLNFLAIVVVGVFQMMAGVVTVGAMQAFVMYSRQLMEPLNALGEHLVRMQNALAGAERIFYVIDLQSEQIEIAEARDGSSMPEILYGSQDMIQIEGLSFEYRRNAPVLRGVHLAVREGERLALVGRTGEGKTTLASLLLLLYPNYSGSIRIGGKDVRSIGPSKLRSQISVVSQEPQIVEGTVCDNLLYGCDDATREDAERVAADLGLDRLLSRLPKGIDTELQSIGESMSQGELQLVCLGRALLQNSSVLILDEATSSVDPNTELFVRNGLERAMFGRTCVVIAHRLSSVQNATHIAVLSDGAIAEYGSHEELMDKKGIYHDLYQSQFLGKEI